MSTHRISDKIAAYVEDYLYKTLEAESTSFEIALMPSPEGAPMLVVFFWIPSPVLGKMSVGSIALSNPTEVTKEGLHGSIRDFFAQMSAARAQALTAPAPAPVRGSQTANGLYVP